MQIITNKIRWGIFSTLILFFATGSLGGFPPPADNSAEIRTEDGKVKIFVRLNSKSLKISDRVGELRDALMDGLLYFRKVFKKQNNISNDKLEELWMDMTSKVDRTGNLSDGTHYTVYYYRLDAWNKIWGTPGKQDWVYPKKKKVVAAPKVQAAKSPDKTVSSGKSLPRRKLEWKAVIFVNERYRYLPALTGANSTAKKLSVALKKHGCRVSIISNASKSKVMEQIADSQKMLQKNQNLLLVFIGRFVASENGTHSYWLTPDASERTVANWIEVSKLLNKVKPRQNAICILSPTLPDVIDIGKNIRMSGMRFDKNRNIDSKVLSFMNSIADKLITSSISKSIDIEN